MRITQLRAFVVAVDEGSLGAAARRLGLSQPTVSQQIASLESECDLRLFARSSRGLTLTAAGETLLPWARQAVAGVESTEQVAQAMRGMDGGTVSFGVMANIEHYALTELASRFHSRHPGVSLRLVGLNSYEVAASVRHGTIEAGLAVLPVPSDELHIVPVGRDEVVWVSSDPERTRRPMTVERIPDAPLILFDTHFGNLDPTRRQVDQRAQLAGVDLRAAIEVERVDSALRLVARGLGDTFVARAVTDSPAFPAGLAVCPFDPPLYDTFALVARRGVPLSPAAEELMQLARELLVGRTAAHDRPPLEVMPRRAGRGDARA